MPGPQFQKQLNLSDVDIGVTRLYQESGQVRNLLVATSWRSGSSFLGELLNQVPGTFYYFEPLHYYSYIRDKATVPPEEDFLTSLYRVGRNIYHFYNNIADLMQCQYDAGYLAHVQNKSHSFLFTRHNKRLWSSCTGFKPREQSCFSAAYLGQVAHLHISPAALVTITCRCVLSTQSDSSKPSDSESRRQGRF